MKKRIKKHQTKNVVYARLADLKHNISYRKVVVWLQRKPFLSFFVALGILLLLIIIGSLMRSLNKTETQAIESVKTVKTFNIGASSQITAQARIEKTGIVKIAAQTAGIVQAIHVSEGQSVARGTKLASFSSNYQGANALGLTSQIAKKQYQNNEDTYTTQKDVVFKQKELARKGETNTEELRKIQIQATQDTKGLLNLNHEIVLGIEANMQTMTDPNDILAAKQLKSQFQAATDQLNNAYRNGAYQTENGLPKELTTLQKEATLAQLDLQDKAIDLQRDVTKMQYQLALISESLMHPASPMTGTVQRIYVKVGQMVQPGTPIATVSQSDQEISAVANIPADVAKSISLTEDSTLTLPNKKVIKLKPTYISSEATEGQLYSVRFTIPKELQANFTDDQFISISLPIKATDTMDTIPLDSVYQTQDKAYVFTVDNGVAIVKTIQLGQVYGKFVQVISGITKGDKIITNRNVIENDKVQVQN